MMNSVPVGSAHGVPVGLLELTRCVRERLEAARRIDPEPAEVAGAAHEGSDAGGADCGVPSRS